MEKCTQCGAPIENGKCTYCGAEYRNEVNNLYVDNTNIFIHHDNNFPNKNNYYSNSNSHDKKIALILCILFGYLGVHYFYVGKVTMGIIYLLTVGLCGIGWIVDIFRIMSGSFKDANNNII